MERHCRLTTSKVEKVVVDPDPDFGFDPDAV
jgi:hypothetical protein